MMHMMNGAGEYNDSDKYYDAQVTKRVAASEEFFRRRMLLQTDLGYHLFMFIRS